MAKSFYWIILFFISNTMNCSVIAKPVEWHLLKNQKGIKVFARPSRQSNLDEFKGIVTIHTKLEVLGRIFKDIPNHKNWLADCKTAREVDRVDKNTMLIYYEFKTPKPFSDRVSYIKSSTQIDINKKWFLIDLKAIDRPESRPDNDKARITYLNGSWYLKQVDNNNVLVIYKIAVNPGGSIPVWLANKTASQIPFITLVNLRDMVRETRYTLK